MLRASYYVEPAQLDLLVFEKLVPTDHYLRKVKTFIDFERFRTELASCYSPDEGRPADDPVLMLKLGFLAFHYNLSDRRVLAETQVNVAYRFFLDLALQSQLPHPSLLSVFRSRLGEAKYQSVFAGIVEQARSLGLVKDRLRLKDATHVIANIAIPATIRLVAQTRQRLLEAVRPLAPERVIQEEARAQAIHTATLDLEEPERLLQRVTHLRAIVLWVEPLLQDLPAHSSDPPARLRQALEEALHLAHKVLADREDPEAGDKLLSLADPDARVGLHGSYFSGYFLDVSMDAHSQIVTALSVLPANGNEAADATALIAQEEAAHHNDIEALSLDNAGFRGELLRQWQDPQGLGLEVYVPPTALPDPQGRFVSKDFVLDPAGQQVTCPAGKETSTRVRNRLGSGWKYQFPRTVCAACALRSQCLGDTPRVTGRQVVKNDYEAEYSAARAKVATPEYKWVRRQHPGIERKLSEFVRRHGGRTARYRGRERVGIQYFLTGAVINIKRIVRLLTSPLPSLSVAVSS
jgi:transposase